MFDTSQAPVRVSWEPGGSGPIRWSQLDEAKAELAWLESRIARARARQVEILAWLAGKRVTIIEAARSLEEWTASTLDVAPPTARDLAAAARHRGTVAGVTEQLESGGISFDRAVAVLNLVGAGGDDADVAASADHDLTRVRRRTAELRHITRVDEAELTRRRHLVVTPTLDHTAWAVTGLLTGDAGHVVAKALQERADLFPPPPDGEREGRAQRQADALTALAHDWLDRRGGDEPAGRGGADITVFVDAADLAASDGERGASIAGGPRIGPATLERLLCGGRVGLVSLDRFGRPVAATDHRHAVPPAVRAAVLNRDQGCVIDGCRSRYRLEIHHVRPRIDSGDNDVGNLVTLCWYHHHIAIHGYNNRLEEGTPPQRRRLTRRPPPRPDG